MGNILIIDDDLDIRDALTRVVTRLGHEARTAATLDEGCRLARAGDVDVVFLDVRMPDGNGLDAIADIRKSASAPEVIVITGWGEADGAELAMRQGAWDYIEKPPSVRTMTAPLLRAMEYRQGGGTLPAATFRFDGITGKSARRAACLELAAKAAVGEVNVLLTGQTGTGKELFARAIHANSPRTDQPFVVVDCAALPATIVESVLFGNEKGAYTGADTRRDGLILQAHGGTLFLDEVGELPLSAQKAFLRVLQERRFRPVGGREEKNCDFRLVAATNQDLEAMSRQGLFRQDLLFRLQGIGIDLPPLRDNVDDVPLFAGHFLDQARLRRGLPEKILSDEFLAALSAYPWPGNIREVCNTMEGVLALARDDQVLHPVHLPLHIRVHAVRSKVEESEAARQVGNGARPAAPFAASGGGAVAPPAAAPESGQALPGDPTAPLPPIKDFRDQHEADYLRLLLTRHAGNMRKILSVSGLSRSRLYALLKKHGLSPERL
ncbi:sigma-54-dependent Fis family transcriptional regulator [Desulfovibrio sulfodismutans]|uniref:Sigma-54-dependent Fis family transcriptional regulator n=1 Tax=Desulfolutivibrio sulfodismutans TaxID=63561 RepID=A0A7K3NI67_9BACT|nr:sigma-54 dependent transcriptional regulator [Desulfolutivibrio sulfodismutans]NDY55485.1 sigma-54-dependent Fis family transcriptional regulator [Desulfolutivibrio sulfodismutans]QLA12873.1 response regulator [Desulfolutivibrio sulfodismutans DSM 3696]